MDGGDATSTPLWTGVAVALVTLFDQAGALDAAATATHAARLVDLGVRAACPGVPVVAGVGGQWWRPAAVQVSAAIAAGADGVLVAPPRRAGDVAEFYRRIAAAASGGTVLAYHYPGVAGGAVPVEQLSALPIGGIKDSTGDPERLLQELDAWQGATYVGSATLVAYAAMLGASGAILAAANAVPEDCVAAWNGDISAQRRIFAAHLAGKSEFPRGLKALVGQRFGTAGWHRLG